MPFFKYRARDRTGRLIKEKIEGLAEEDMVNYLQARGLYVISISPAVSVRHIKKAKRRYHHGVKLFDLVMFARELATLLTSGVTLIKSLEILCKQIESLTLLNAVQEIKKDIESGYTFQNALKKHDKIFFWFLDTFD